ncbi:MAG: hypothetical protein LBR48_05410 [Dysgonamonadaceae bacterium]|jgi:hypothetical protein|nr:hypothetical protein [Dysgonamonadaceae bacterium]
MNKLDDIKKKNPFTVPENYFADFNANIMARLPEKEARNTPKKISMWGKSHPWIYAAAMIAGIVLIITVATKKPAVEPQHLATASSQSAKAVNSSDTYWSNVSISEDEFYQYLEDQLTDDGYYNYLYDELYHQTQNM